MVAEAIEESGREFLVAEDLDLLAEGQVGGDEGGAALVALGHEVEEQFAVGAVKGDYIGIVPRARTRMEGALL